MNGAKPNPFTRPKTPKNSWELWRWIIFDYQLVKDYEKRLRTLEQLWAFFKAYVMACFIMIGVGIGLWFVMAGLIYFSSLNESDLVTAWQTKNIFPVNPIVFLEYTWNHLVGDLAGDLALGLVLGLVLGLILSLGLGLVPSLGLGFLLGLVSGLVPSLGHDISLSIMCSLTLCLTSSLVLDLTKGFNQSLKYGLIIGFILCLMDLIIGLIFIFIYFRFNFYFRRQMQTFFNLTLDQNVYLKDGTIWLPLWGVQKELTLQAQQNPALAQQFTNFLLQYRPLQQKLAQHLTHAAQSGFFQQKTLDFRLLSVPFISKKHPKFRVSSDWEKQLNVVREKLKRYQDQTSISLKHYYFQKFIPAFKQWRIVNLQENHLWKDYYTPFFDQWDKAIADKQAHLDQRLLCQEPITSNIYRTGEALQPHLINNKELLLGRNNLKEELVIRILTAQTMPLLLLQGQRLVGKTSLLHFLPELLDPQTFTIVFQDLQGKGDVYLWLEDLHQRITDTLYIDSLTWKAPRTSWLAAWLELEAYMNSLALDKEMHLILAMDEYDALQKAFSGDVAQAEQLLSALRSFTQYQNRIGFLFVGAAFLSDLKEPNWSRFFVRIETLYVHYLNKEATYQLVTHPIPDFGIRYTTAVPERIYELTQGHPTLIQSICKRLVDIANTRSLSKLGEKELEEVLDKYILEEKEYMPIYIFWEGEFCCPKDYPFAQQTVREVIERQPVTHKNSLRRLLKHRYILKDTTQQYPYRLTVPLFEEWIKRRIRS